MKLIKSAAGIAIGGSLLLPSAWSKRAGEVNLGSVLSACPDCNLVVFSYSSVARARLRLYGHANPTDRETEKYVTDGLVFDHHFAASGWPLQSQISLYTGQHLPGHNVLNNGFHNRLLYSRFNLKEDRIAPDTVTLAELAKRNGYETFFIGGAPHQNFYSSQMGVTRGIDRLVDRCLHYHEDAGEVRKLISALREKRFFGIVNTVRTHFPHFLTPESYKSEFTTYHYQGYFPSSEEEFKRQMKAGWPDLLSFLNKNPSPGNPDLLRSRQFANDDHWFIDVARMVDGQKAIAHYLNNYDQAIRFADHFIGELFRSLEEHALLERTIVIVTSDVGANSFESYVSGPRPSFGYGTSTPEAVQIPLIVYHPQLRKKKSGLLRYGGITNSTDVYPTVAALLGWRTAGSRLDGENLLSSEASLRRVSPSYTYRPHRGLTVGIHNREGSLILSKRETAFFDRAKRLFITPRDAVFKKNKTVLELRSQEAAARKLIEDKRFPNLTDPPGAKPNP
jgi:arylsulfatase A-like enzyme